MESVRTMKTNLVLGLKKRGHGKNVSPRSCLSPNMALREKTLRTCGEETGHPKPRRRTLNLLDALVWSTVVMHSDGVLIPHVHSATVSRFFMPPRSCIFLTVQEVIFSGGKIDKTRSPG